MPLLKEQDYTIEDIFALPDGERAELIGGQLCDMAPSSGIHQKLSYELSRVIGNHIRAAGGKCEVYPAPFAVFLTEDERNYVEPDISVICDKTKLSDRGCEGAPDWIIEVVSPGSRRMDYSIKNMLYSCSGVREYWIADPQKKRVTVYRYEEDAAPAVMPFDADTTVGIYPDLTINIMELL